MRTDTLNTASDFKSFPYSGELSTIDNFDSFIDGLRNKIGKQCNFQASPKLYFRGHCSSQFQLSAKFNRDFKLSDKSVDSISKTEQALVEEFESLLKQKNLYKHISLYSSTEAGYGGLWERIGQYQHAGLATRFLDWSNSWLVALFFALNDTTQVHLKQSSDFWIFDLTRVSVLHEENLTTQSPYHIKWPIPYHSKNYVDESYQIQVGVLNKLHQGGHFFVQSHVDSFVPIEESQDYRERLQRWEIKPDNKEKIMKEILAKHGIKYYCGVYEGFKVLSKKYYVKTCWAKRICIIANELNKKYLTE